ncbi:rolling circle replication-associated protein [Bacillus massilinigeriensis]|uniref:rolling circle replication-associated protein n=1 Tax=Bacillus massilionigeriensis TaxID=1805475 RepID=UPI00096B1AAF|nr:hypothetical protein [Bacillus massilionigeriensis]
MLIMNPSTTRLIISGNRVEVYDYERPIIPVSARPKVNNQISTLDTDYIKQYQLQVYYKARKQMKRLYHCNFVDASAKFITLLFDDNIMQEATNVQTCKVEFDKFMKRLRRQFPDIQYMAVTEFQDKNSRGTVHYHMIANIPYMPHEQLQALWGNGFVSISSITDDINTGEMLTQYLTKGVRDPRLKGHHNYLRSRNLKLPLIVEGEEAQTIIQQYNLYKQHLVTSRMYETQFQGMTSYQEYALKQCVEMTNLKGLDI